MKRFKKILRWTAALLLLFGAIGGTLYLIYLRPFLQKMKVITSISFDKELTIITGGGGNSGILVSDSLVVVIDTKMDDEAKNLHEKVKQLAGNKPVMVINTHFHPDHCGGNSLYTGQTILAGANYGKEVWIKEAGERSLPNTWLTGRRDLRMNDDTLTILNYGKNAHTESDVFVYLHKRKLLFAGDVILNKQHPIIMGKGSPEGYLDAFGFLMLDFDIQHIVPGHGDVGGKELLDNYKNYFIDMKLAAKDEHLAEQLIPKYKDWGSIPFFMSSQATIEAFKKEQ